MTVDSKHTPLPWKLRDSHEENYEIVKAESGKIGRIVIAEISDQNYDYGKSNGEFIVEAVNNYYSLKEQNQKLREAIKTQNETLKAVISGQRVVNLDEAIAFYESIIKS